ncbi:hypothetical protein EJ05DRAFT_503173 [Pseudovirgaria hyperparasitica]|uniref:Uncharacterized protein n=1 Tax=Pseudovirgaria hyperparasitica TaxID=470096 RepID=A0A6A6W0U5_9PEZI|nr:uncharacterized protein EJ05DRAFT_503173 [Pseudovirgaria hyperparasitica]KAF2755716.1 hypothetical protein EJ05DRAFT_503173 [Pseudovirgaria hyperparasitica]
MSTNIKLTIIITITLRQQQRNQQSHASNAATMPNFKALLTGRTPLYILAIPVLVLYALLLAACTSPASVLANMYLVKLTAGADEARIGFFGICTSTSSSQTLLCTTSPPSPSSTPTNPLTTPAHTLQKSTFYPLLAGSAALYILSLLLFLSLSFLSGLNSKPTAKAGLSTACGGAGYGWEGAGWGSW